jgi:hypothetical protein
MSVSKTQVEATLAVVDEAALSAIMEAAGINSRGAQSRAELASRITDALWWNYSTPVGYLADRTTLDDIVGHVAKRLKVSNQVGGTDAWAQLRSLTQALSIEVAGQGVRAEDLDQSSQNRLSNSWWSTAAYGSSATGSFGARFAAVRVLRFAKGPIGKWIPLFPPLRPYFAAIVKGAGAVSLVAGPLGVALSVLAINDALGANYRRLVPLLLGIGALGPSPVGEAAEVS